jgi:hypothetical protein
MAWLTVGAMCLAADRPTTAAGTFGVVRSPSSTSPAVISKKPNLPLRDRSGREDILLLKPLCLLK